MSSIFRSWLAVLALCGVVWGCQPTPEGTETLDAGGTPSESDAGPGESDAGGIADAGPEDAGSTTDAGDTSDAGLVDAGPPPECVVDQDCASNRCEAGRCNPPPQSTPLPPGELTDIEDSTRFLYTGSNPVQRGVDAGTIEARRLAVIRGQVRARGGAPLADVRVTILSHPEYGYTFTRADGQFDLVVNGGGPVTLSYQRADLLPIQRTLASTPWRDFIWAPEVVMIGRDPVATAIELATLSDIAVARGSAMTDSAGTRQATLLFTPGTTATRVKADGTTEPLSRMTVRATEYTVGADGPNAMPGELPPTTGYTYAAELSVDEVGFDEEVRFNQPVAFYVDNFLAFPVGGIVPVGYYDRKTAAWIASDNGRVISILSIEGGMAALDVNGQGLAATEAELAALGISEAERAKLATLYPVGASLWRSPITHFTPWDCNWPYAPPPDATPPPPSPDTPPEPEDPCKQAGSIIECQSQTLGEVFPIEGTPHQLRYSSRWQRGPTIPVVITDSSAPSSLKRVEVKLTYAGRKILETFDGTPNRKKLFRLERTDAYGRKLSGYLPVRVAVKYVYPTVYTAPANFAAAFGNLSQTGTAIGADRGRNEVYSTRAFEKQVAFYLDQIGTLGGLRLDVHHTITPDGKRLMMGDGTERSLDATMRTFRFPVDGSVPGVNSSGELQNISSVAYAPDGTLYVGYDFRVIRIDGVTQKVTHFAGNGTGYNIYATDADVGDNGPATLARVNGDGGLAVGPDGSVYIADFYRVRRVDPSTGIITTVAGGGGTTLIDTPLPARSASLQLAIGVSVASDGTVFIADDSRNRNYVLRLDRTGMLTRLAGGQNLGFSGDNGPAASAQICWPWGTALDNSGALFFTDSANYRIRRIGPEGIITTVAGGGTLGDGSLAVNAKLDYPQGIAMRDDGSLLIVDGRRIREVTPGGIIRTFAGNGLSGTAVDGAPATSQPLSWAQGIALGPKGVVAIADSSYLRLVTPTVPRSAAGELLYPFGNEVFVFDTHERHVRTVDAVDGRVLRSFEYTAEGRLSGVRDAKNRLTRIERDANGNPTAIVAPGGERTTLATDASGRLSRITHPNGTFEALSYDAEGLLSELTDAAGGKHLFSYDPEGRLTRDEGPGGFVKMLTRTDTSQGYDITVTSGLGRAVTYRTVGLPAGGTQSIVIGPDGAQTETIRGTDGAVIVRRADGSFTENKTKPDSVWGALLPRQGSSVRKLGTFSTSATETWATTLTDPLNPFSVSTQTRTVSAGGETFKEAWDASSRRMTQTAPNGKTRVQEFDVEGRLVRQETQGQPPTQYVFDDQGQLTELLRGTGAEARSLRFAYDAKGRLSSTVDALGRSTQFEYDAEGNLTARIRPDGSLVRMGYDAQGRMTSFTPPGRSPFLLAHHANGRLSKFTWPLGTMVTHRTFDADGRLTRVTKPDGATVDLSYDPVTRQLTGITTAEGTRQYGYTGGALTSLTQPGGATLAITYGGASTLASEQWSGPVTGTIGRTTSQAPNRLEPRVDGYWTNAPPASVSNVYGADGQVAAVGPLTLTRDASSGRVSGTALGNLASQLTYNSFGEVTSTTYSYAGGALFQAVHTRDALGSITRTVESLAGTSTTYDYRYDLLGRLVAVDKDGAAFSTYGYDANGNRTQTNGVAFCTVDGEDKLLAAPGATFEFTGNGQVKARVEGANRTEYRYSTQGALLEVQLPDGSRISYIYDGLGRRVGRAVNGVLVQGFLFRNPLKPAAELNGAGQVVSEFVYASRGLVPDFIRKNGRTYRVVADVRGSVRLVVDTADGSIAQRLDYDPWGRVTQDTNPGFQPFGYAGGYYDATTGLVQFGARDYDARLGRWLEPDPLELGGGSTNLFMYAENDPVNFVDPTGFNVAEPTCEALMDFVNHGNIWDLIADGYGPAGSGKSAAMNAPYDTIYGPVDGDWMVNQAYAASLFTLQGSMIESLGDLIGSEETSLQGRLLKEINAEFWGGFGYALGKPLWNLMNMAMNMYANGHPGVHPYTNFLDPQQLRGYQDILPQWMSGNMTLRQLFAPSVEKCEKCGKL